MIDECTQTYVDEPVEISVFEKPKKGNNIKERKVEGYIKERKVEGYNYFVDFSKPDTIDAKVVNHKKKKVSKKNKKNKENISRNTKENVSKNAIGIRQMSGMFLQSEFLECLDCASVFFEIERESS